MTSFIKSHPFPVEAYFNSSIVLAFAIPKELIQHLIPECLTLDIFEEKWAFIAVAMVQTENLRPQGMPKIFGNDFFLIGYRVFVRYRNNSGRSMRGLYILRSETDKLRMQVFGNIFTHYNYHKIDISKHTENSTVTISSDTAGLLIKIEKSDVEKELPLQSPFKTWQEARKFAGPMPYTFTYDKKNKEVLIIEGVRQNWKPKAIKVLEHNIEFLDKLNLSEIRLANAFIIENVPYYWKKGKVEKWRT